MQRMSLPVRTLPVLQNWDCHVTGTCCKEYRVNLSPDEVERITQQGWDVEKDLGGLPATKQVGPPWSRQVELNHHEDGTCVFLSAEGRCRIHERFGYEAKPLPCRLFPFVLVPAGDHWRVGLRYACPSAAANKGRPLPAHDEALAEFAARLAERAGLKPRPDGSLTAPPLLQAGQRVDWPDLLRVVQTLLNFLRNRRDPMELRLRKCLALVAEMRKVRLDGIQG